MRLLSAFFVSLLIGVVIVVKEWLETIIMMETLRNIKESLKGVHIINRLIILILKCIRILRNHFETILLR